MSTTWNETDARTAPQTKSAEVVVEAPAVAAPTAKKGGRARIVLPALVAIAATVGGISYARGLGNESTDDAQVEGHIVNVAARATGQVARVLVHDNQLVDEGAVLLEIDDRDLQARLLGARADLASAKAQLASANAQLALTERNVLASLKQAKGGIAQASSGFLSSHAASDQARADIAVATSKRTLSETDQKRAEALFTQGAISQAEVDRQRAGFDQADAQLAQARARLAAAEAGSASTAGAVESAQGRLAQAETGPEQLDAARAASGVASARVEQAAAALSLSELNLSYAKVKAPMRGVVSRRSVEPGQLVSPERTLLALVPPDDVWIVANFKEDQVKEMRPGQKVDVKVDTYGRRIFAAHVESLAGASGSRFALLPPDNASGNFTKVVQRFPVLIRLDAPPDVAFRPGMSAFASVTTK
jgi:membrane fusion protein (multidrug efflux system)